jgi:hypothetical protein
MSAIAEVAAALVMEGDSRLADAFASMGTVQACLNILRAPDMQIKPQSFALKSRAPDCPTRATASGSPKLAAFGLLKELCARSPEARRLVALPPPGKCSTPLYRCPP